MITLFRGREIIAHPSFWAEDATFFFADSLNLGFKSIFLPIVGHYHFLPRILAFLISKTSIFYAPLLYIVCSCIISSLTQAYFIKDTFAWILPSKIARFVICLFLSILPGSESVSFAFCTMCYVLFGFITLILLEKSDLEKSNLTSQKRFHLAQNLLLSFLWFSSGQGIIFLPILLFDIFRKNYFRIVPLIFLLISISLNIQAAFAVKGNFEVVKLGINDFVYLIQIYFDNFFFHLINHPVLGIPNSRKLDSMGSLVFYLVSSILFLWLIYRLLRKNQNYLSSHYSFIQKNENSIRLILIYICSISSFIMIGWLRRDATSLLHRPNFIIDDRYAYQPLILSQVFWILVFRNFNTEIFHSMNLYLKNFLLCLLVTIFINNIYHENYPNYLKALPPFDEIWPERVKQIERGLEVRKNGVDEKVKVDFIPCRPPWWRGGKLGGIDFMEFTGKK